MQRLHTSVRKTFPEGSEHINVQGWVKNASFISPKIIYLYLFHYILQFLKKKKKERKCNIQSRIIVDSNVWLKLNDRKLSIIVISITTILWFPFFEVLVSLYSFSQTDVDTGWWIPGNHQLLGKNEYSPTGWWAVAGGSWLLPGEFSDKEGAPPVLIVFAFLADCLGCQ